MKHDTIRGLGLFALFALILALGLRYGDGVIRRFHLDSPVRSLPVLMYHAVAPDGTENLEETQVTVSKLRRDLEYLQKAGYTTVLPRELLSGEPLPEKIVLLTFDDGYQNNYDLLFPLLREYGMKAVLSPVVSLTDQEAEGYCTWAMLREMDASGLVEIGSHTYALHNLENHGMAYPAGEANGIQRRRGESREAFQARVPEDLRRSYERLTQELGRPPVCFAYPFGTVEPEAQGVLDALFPVSLTTRSGIGDLARGTRRLPRITMAMGKDLPGILP